MNLDAQKGSNILWNAWQTGAVIDGLPEDLKPVSRANAYAMQALLAAHSSRPPVGWKIAATSAAGQKHINVSGPVAGRLLAERVHADGVTLSMTGNHMAVAEAEFVFCMGQSMPPRPEPIP